MDPVPEELEELDPELELAVSFFADEEEELESFEPESFEPESFEPESFEPESFEPESFEPESFEREPSAPARLSVR